MQISATSEVIEPNREYNCPLYVLGDFPTSLPLVSSEGRQFKTNGMTECFMKVPLMTAEEPEDCAAFGVAMYSCPKWASPSLLD